MRKISLILSVLIGFIGTVVYFMTIPTVDEDTLVNVVVEAGDEQVLDGIYFDGYIYDYSDFHFTTEGVHTTEGLSYLDKLDAPHYMALQEIQKSYPEFIDGMIYNSNFYSNNLVYSENYLASAHFELTEGNYRIETEKMHLNILEKDSKEVHSEIVNRSNEGFGDSIEVIGLYEDYPTMKVLLAETNWPNNYSEGTSRIILGEYNFETKSYTEEKVFEEQGSFYGDYVSQSRKTVLIDYYSESEDGTYIFDYDNGSLMTLESDEKIFLLDDQSNLFAVASIEGDVVLQSYEMTDGGGLEPVEQIPLSIDFELLLKQDESALVEAELIGDYLYVIQNKENFESDGEVFPASIQVFNRASGESVMSGYISFDEKNQVNARSGTIDSIGQLSDYQ